MGRATGERRERIKEEIDAVVKELIEKHQNKGGLWRHEYYNVFVTSSVLMSLYVAHKAGAKVDADSVAKAVKALKSIRSERGTWPYHPRPGSMPEAWKGGIGRAVNAEAAMFAWGEGSQAALERALRKYLYWNFVQERVRKHSYHSDGYGTGGFFYWFNAHVFGQAMRLAKGEAAVEAAKGIREQILATREIDGTFVDSFQLGKTYATAMALLTLDACRDVLGE